jgi:hypothetical protein
MLISVRALYSMDYSKRQLRVYISKTSIQTLQDLANTSGESISHTIDKLIEESQCRAQREHATTAPRLNR